MNKEILLHRLKDGEKTLITEKGIKYEIDLGEHYILINGKKLECLENASYEWQYKNDKWRFIAINKNRKYEIMFIEKMETYNDGDQITTLQVMFSDWIWFKYTQFDLAGYMTIDFRYPIAE